MESIWVLAQTVECGSPEQNLKRAETLVKKAVTEYAPNIMVFPEVYSSHYPLKTERDTMLAAAQPLEGPFVEGMRQLAKNYHLWLIFGLREQTEDATDDRAYNTVVLVDADGEIVSTYHKVHLYDAFGYQESRNVKPGTEYFTPLETPFGVLGVFVCYELRYPEVARNLTKQGAEILVMPTAWVKGPRKEKQFHTLITARAIENASYMVACDMCGEDCIGESVVVNPQGEVVAKAGVDECLICARIDSKLVQTTRERVPSYKGV